MKPYKWEETEEQYIAVVQPEKLFIEGSIFEKGRHKYRTYWFGMLKESNEEDIYAFGFQKKWISREWVEREVLKINDALTWKAEEEKHQDRQVA